MVNYRKDHRETLNNNVLKFSLNIDVSPVYMNDAWLNSYASYIIKLIHVMILNSH